MAGSEIIGIWIAAFLTLCIFSFLYKDNPFYKFAEHLFVGVSAGYQMAVQYQDVLKPNLFNKLHKAFAALAEGKGLVLEMAYILPAILGVLLVLRLLPRISWISRWPLAFMVGIQAGLNIVYVMDAQVLKQINATILPLVSGASPSDLAVNWIIFVGVLTGLIYFYFSVEHRGPIMGVGSRIGIYVLMIAFGASFGYTVMARVSLLIGRMLFFKNDWWMAARALFHHGP